MPESPSTKRRGTIPPLPTPPTASTSTMGLRTLARVGLQNLNGTNQVSLQGPPAWTLTKTPWSKEPLLAHPLTKASLPQRPKANKGVYKENFFTPLYSEPQAADHTYVNTTQQPPTPAATRDAEIAAAAATTKAEAAESAAAAATKRQATGDMEAEAAAEDAAALIASRATEA